MNGAAETPLPPHQRPPVDGFRLGEGAGNVGKSQHQSAHCRVQGPGCGICHEADADRDQPPPPPPRRAGSFLPSRTGLGHNRKHTRHDTVRVCSAPRPPTHTARVCAAVARHLRARACRPSVCGLPRHGARLRLRAATARGTALAPWAPLADFTIQRAVAHQVGLAVWIAGRLQLPGVIVVVVCTPGVGTGALRGGFALCKWKA